MNILVEHKSKVLSALLLWGVFASCNDNKTGTNGTGSVDSTKTAVSDSSSKKAPAKMTDDDIKLASKNYLMPEPGAIFAALSKFGKVDWKSTTTFSVNAKVADNASKAFAMGASIANSYIAIQANDHNKLTSTSEQIYQFGKELGLEKEIAKAKTELATRMKNNNDSMLPSAVNGVFEDFRTSSAKITNGKDYFLYASLGGWMQGIRSVTNHLIANYNEKPTELIKDVNPINSLKDGIQASSLAFDKKADLIKNLNDLAALIANKQSLSKDDIVKINANVNNTFKLFNQ